MTTLREAELRRLLAAYRGGDPKAAGPLMELVAAITAATARNCLHRQEGCTAAVEEVVNDGQDLFWTKFVEPSAEDGPAEEVRSYVAWLRFCARNRALDKLRQLKRRVAMSGDGFGIVESTTLTSPVELRRMWDRDVQLCAFALIEFERIFRRSTENLPSILYLRAAYHSAKPHKRCLLAGEAAGLSETEIAKVHELFAGARVPEVRQSLDKRRTDSMAQDKVRLRMAACELVQSLTPEQALQRAGSGHADLHIAHLLTMQLDRLVDPDRQHWLEPDAPLSADDRFSVREIIVLAAYALGDTPPTIAKVFGIAVTMITAVIARATRLGREEL